MPSKFSLAACSNISYSSPNIQGAGNDREPLDPVVPVSRKRTLLSGTEVMAELHSSTVMPPFTRDIQYAVTFRIGAKRLWNTGSPGQAGRRRQNKLFDH
jgi:hypothetical protein